MKKIVLLLLLTAGIQQLKAQTIKPLTTPNLSLSNGLDSNFFKPKTPSPLQQLIKPQDSQGNLQTMIASVANKRITYSQVDHMPIVNLATDKVEHMPVAHISKINIDHMPVVGPIDTDTYIVKPYLLPGKKKMP
jgi:hypothetical protein